MKCSRCNTEWQIQDNLSAYEGEVVLVCPNCDNRYYNAQEHFHADEFVRLTHVVVKGDRLDQHPHRIVPASE